MTKAPLAGEKNRAFSGGSKQNGHQTLVARGGGGVPVGLSVAGANRHDFKLLEETLQSIPIDQPGAAEEYLRHLLHADGLVAHLGSRGEEAQAKKKEKRGEKARRWVVERTHSWFNRFRSILTRWNKKAKNYLAMLYFVCGLIAYRAALFFG